MKNEISENVMLFDWVTLSYKGEDPQPFVDLLGISMGQNTINFHFVQLHDILNESKRKCVAAVVWSDFLF